MAIKPNKTEDRESACKTILNNESKDDPNLENKRELQKNRLETRIEKMQKNV